jgi:hypothetical protein
MAVYAAWLACCHDYRPALAPGERGQLMVLAPTRDQAANLFRFVEGALATASALRGLVEGVTADTISLSSRIDVVIRPASYRSTRGSTCIGILCDETSFWRSEEAAQPDTEVLRALRPSLATTGGPLISISSPYARKGELWKAYKRHYAKDDSDVLVIQAPSLIMNPGLDKSFVDRQYDDDPVAAAAEYGAEFRTDVESFVSIEVLESCVADGVFEVLPAAGIAYVAFVDPSGGSSDSMTLAIAHRDEDGTVILDCVRDAKPPFSPESVVEEFAAVLASYHVGVVTGDRYAGEWPREQFAKRNIIYRLSDRTKTEIYQAFLPLLNSRRARLLDNQRLLKQFLSLERKTARGGRDSIDKSPGTHDDIANSVAGALVLAGLRPVADIKFCQPYVYSRPSSNPFGDRTPMPDFSNRGFN